jgi:hypothetical protein
VTGYVDLALGAILIIVYTSDRFNTPPTNRSSTTAARYYTAAGSYVIVALAVYGFLIRFPHLLQSLLAIVNQSDAAAVPGWATTLSTPLLVAVLLTALLPRVPILSGIDEWIRKKLQHMAAIPYEVRRLSAELRKSPFHVTDQRQQEIRVALQQEGFQDRDILFGDSPAPQSLWTRIAVLMGYLEEWESQSRFAGFVASFASEFGALKKRHRQLVPKAKNCFRLRQDHGPDASGQIGDAVAAYQGDFVEQATELLQSIHDFIGRGVLQCELTHSARREQLEAMGFRVQLSRPRLTLNELVALFMGLSVVLVLGFVVVGQRTMSGALLVQAVMISTIYSVAVWCAIYPKDKWNFARRTPGDFRPVASYLAAGLLAVSAGSLINLGIKFAMLWDVPGAWEAFWRARPWVLMTFVTAFVTAWLTDDRPSATLPAARLRWVEGLAQATVTLGTAWVVYGLLQQTNPTRVPPLLGVMSLSGVIGFIIGFCVPTWYRDAPRQPHGPHELESPQRDLPGLGLLSDRIVKA